MPTRIRPALTALSALATLALLPAQAPLDLLGVDFGVTLQPNSTAHRVTLNPLTQAPIGSTGVPGLNALATVHGVLYSVAVAGSPPTRQLVRIDPLTGAATTLAPLTPDIRALSDNPAGGDLFGIADRTPDALVRINVASGVVTAVGPTGFSGIQGLAHDGNELFAWDVNQGLLRINTNTGAATDVDPALTTGGADIQFLTWSGSELLGGRDGLFRINRSTGVPTTLIASVGTTDLRGAEVRRASPFGTGCAPSGTPPRLSLPGEVRAGGTVLARMHSVPFATLGLLVVGLSNTTWNGVPLPVDLGPIVGATNCDLLVSADLILAGAAGASGILDVPLALPNMVGFDVHIQLMSLQGGLANLRSTNAATIRLLP